MVQRVPLEPFLLRQSIGHSNGNPVGVPASEWHLSRRNLAVDGKRLGRTGADAWHSVGADCLAPVRGPRGVRVQRIG